MIDFSKMGLKKEEIPIDYEHVPEQFTVGAPPLQPGTYHFQLPPTNIMEDIANFATGSKGGGWRETIRGDKQRVSYAFDAEHPLTVTWAQSSLNANAVGTIWRGWISNAERNRGRNGEPEQLVSDMLFLLRFGLNDATLKKGATNEDYIKALISHAGEQFQADNEFSAFAKPGTVKRFRAADGSVVEDPGGSKYDAKINYYQKDIEKDPATGLYPTQVQLPDGSILYCNGNLSRFKAL